MKGRRLADAKDLLLQRQESIEHYAMSLSDELTKRLGFSTDKNLFSVKDNIEKLDLNS